MSSRARLRIAAALALSGLTTLVASSCSVDLGDMPARCSDGQCPDGYDCIQGVCALPGTKVPITVGRTGNLRGVDLRIVPQSGSILVAWETYAYSPELQGFVGRRIFPDGTASQVLDLDKTFEADAGLLEPYFDLLPIDDTHALLAVTAPAVDDDPRPRIAIYGVSLPAEHAESEGATSSRVGDELRVSTIGYGAVSRPRLARVGPDDVELGYVVSRATDTATSAALGVLDLDATGKVRAPLPTCVTGATPDTCPAVRLGDLPVAVGVLDAFGVGGETFWTLDDARPSVLAYDVDAMPVELALPPLAVPLVADASGVVYLEPSARGGTQLPSDPVEGPASLGRVQIATPTKDEHLFELPGIRDTPRPAWIPRDGKPSLLVTPGTAIDSPTLDVFQVDTTTGEAKSVATIERFSSLEVGAVGAALVDGHLYVVWFDDGDDQATIRAAVLDEP
ncbi:MAG TPA: hypothetical protein VL400_01335 [Polyangiaceae bacterium]|nr:hypothetical protein [Polyangiaceae bacterium]